MPKKEESMLEEMRAAIARDREKLVRGSPLVESPAQPTAPPPRRARLTRLWPRKR
jgi:hypothetical protein